MPTPRLTDDLCIQAVEALRVHGNKQAAADALGIPRNTFANRYNTAEQRGFAKPAYKALSEGCGYNLDGPERTPEEAWNAHVSTFERTYTETSKKRWQRIKRPKGPFCIFHTTDEHLDDNGTPLRVIEQDIKAARDMNAVMVHGGDALNNWPMAGKLAKKWADQECTMPDALLRLQHFIEILQPDVWIDGNHEEMNPYLAQLIDSYLPDGIIRDYWTAQFVVETPGGRDCRAVVSHKFQKGSSWFHKAHGHIREMLEGEPCDLLMDGHVHSDGVLDHSIPERSHSALCVASAGYKMFDRFATRISRGGKVPKMRGRCHFIIGDPQAEPDESMCTAFKSARQAEAFMGGLQNLRAV